MTLPVAYLSQAQDEAAAAYLDYEQQRSGLGAQFLDDLSDQIARVRANPALYAVLHRDVWAATLSRFPYVVYYRIEPARILIVAVQHGSRSPHAWKGRV